MIGIFFRNLFRDLVRQPLRTALTLSGVVWGTFSVVLLLAFGDSVSQGPDQALPRHGPGHRPRLPFADDPRLAGIPQGQGRAGHAGDGRGHPGEGRRHRVDQPGVRRQPPHPLRPEGVPEHRPRRQSRVRADAQHHRRAEGGSSTPRTWPARKRVCFIGDVLATDLFATEEPVGKAVFIDSVPFTVVGVMRKKLQNSNYNGQRDEHCAFIPWTTYASLYGTKYVSNIIFRPARPRPEQGGHGGHQDAPGQARRLLPGRPRRPRRLGHAGVREAVHDLLPGLHGLPGRHRLVHPPRRRRRRGLDHEGRRRRADARDRRQAGRRAPAAGRSSGSSSASRS